MTVNDSFTTNPHLTNRISTHERFITAYLNTMLQWLVYHHDPIAATKEGTHPSSASSGSALIYCYATLRDIVLENEITFAENKDKKNAVAFLEPELIYTQHHEEEPIFDTYMKYPVTALGILRFIKLNRGYLKEVDGTLTFHEDGDAHLGKEGGHEFLDISKRLVQVDDDEFDADIIEFDDEFEEEGLKAELVYSIVVNRTEKRVTVVFRGSYTMKDFLIDATMTKYNPVEVRKFAGEKPLLHSGFCNYLLVDTLDSDISKLEQIIGILKQVFAFKKDGRDYSNYELYITGHSLGGALAQILAFILAGTLESEGLPVKKVNAVTFASPRCGNHHYYKAFAALEKEGKLRHIRVSNEGDAIPDCFGPGYTQTGLNLHLHPNRRLEVGHHVNRTFWSQFRFNPLDAHYLGSYHSNLFIDENADIIGMSIEELYAKYTKKAGKKSWFSFRFSTKHKSRGKLGSSAAQHAEKTPWFSSRFSTKPRNSKESHKVTNTGDYDSNSDEERRSCCCLRRR